MDPNSTLLKVLLVLMGLLGVGLIALPGGCGLVILVSNFDGGSFNSSQILPILAMCGVPMAVGAALVIGAWVGAKAQRTAVAEARALEDWAANAAALAVRAPGTATSASADAPATASQPHAPPHEPTQPEPPPKQPNT